MITYDDACERILRFLRLAEHRESARIQSVKEYDSHWLLTYVVPSSEDPSRIFMTAQIVAEKRTGHVYCFPSRAREPIDSANMDSIRRGCQEITPDDLDRLEE